MQWDVPSHRIRAYVRAVRRGGSAWRGQAASLRLKKATAEIKVAELGLLRTQLLLNELTPRGLTLYSHQRLEPGQQLSIVLDTPRQFYAQAIVVGCSSDPASSFRVLSNNPCAYRLYVEFLFESAIEEQMVQSFYAQVQCTLNASS
jgi:hypothetical protein